MGFSMTFVIKYELTRHSAFWRIIISVPSSIANKPPLAQLVSIPARNRKVKGATAVGRTS